MTDPNITPTPAEAPAPAEAPTPAPAETLAQPAAPVKAPQKPAAQQPAPRPALPHRATDTILAAVALATAFLFWRWGAWGGLAGLAGEPPMKQKDIAARIGCSRARISWILKEDLQVKRGYA